jgi:amino acid transporter
VAVALVPVGTLEASETPLVEVVKAGAPNLPIETILPFISMFAVSNTALINMLMASRLIYGMSRQHVLPPVLGLVHPKSRAPWVAILFTTLIAFGLIFYVTAFANSSAISLLGGTTSLLLLAVFAMVNVAVLVLRRDVRATGGHFKTPTVLPIIGFLASIYLVLPFSGRPAQQYLLAGILVLTGIVLFGITMLINKQLGIRGAGINDPTHLGEAP